MGVAKSLATCVKSLAAFVSSVSVTWVSSLLRGGSWLAFQDFPTMGAVFIQDLAANSGRSWMSQAPNLHFARQLLIFFFIVSYQ